MRQTFKGRAFPISAKQAKSYYEVEAPKRRRMKANPMGVTAIAEINGKGAYRSARKAAAGKTQAQRLARARAVLSGDDDMKRASFVRNAARKAPAKRTTKKATGGYNFARGSTSTRGTKSRFDTAAFGRSLAPTSKAQAAALEAQAKEAKKEAARLRRQAKKEAAAQKRAAAAKAKKSAQRKSRLAATRSGKAPRKKLPPKVKRAGGMATVPSSKRVRVAYGKYPRAKLPNYRKGGKTEYSYMYYGRDGKLHKIPKSALKAAGITDATITKKRKSRSRQIEKRGGAFTPNLRGKAVGRKSAAQKRRGKRLAAYRAAICRGLKKEGAVRSALRAVPLKQGDTFMGRTKATKKTTARRTTRRKMTANGKGSHSMKKTKMRKNRPLTKAQRSAAARKGARTRKRNQALKRAATRKRTATTTRRRATAARRRPTTRRRTSAKRRMPKRNSKGQFVKRRSAAPTRRRKVTKTSRRRTTMKGRRRSMRRNGRRRSLFKRNGFGSVLMNFLKFGSLAAGGFLVHRGLTSLATHFIVDEMLMKPASGTPSNTALTVKKYEKPIFGLAVLAVGLPAAHYLGKAVSKRDSKVATAIGAGMVASYLQSLVVSVLTAANQPDVARYLSGYSNSMAYGLRGPYEAYASSIMPRYAPVGEYFTPNGFGDYTQAAAGFQQAAAGMGQNPAFTQAAAGMGEYFTPNATGEYFAPMSTQGVGGYEGAGALAQVPNNQVIDDGIRPENAERMLMLTEAAAGFQQAAAGMGEYYSAMRDNGEFVESQVPMQSQVVPNGPLWAGTLGVGDKQTQSELPAGILARDGGNGILSAG